jgi:asparagine synthase (glutamine-hydrolysing)
MCGIAGIFSYDSDKRVTLELLEKMASVLGHRGPDDKGVEIFSGGKAGFSHRRLSIIDVEGGHQPLSNEDGTVWIVFNGEIYNFQELRKGLERNGHRFRSRSDTEVVVHLYEEKGTRCLDDVRGMFAFAIWDEREERLFLARDRLGQKPLVYTFRDGQCAFASEIKGLLQLPDIKRTVNPAALHDYLTYQYVPHPLTMFEGIEKLSPAHYMVIEKRKKEIQRYWTVDFSREENLPELEYSRRVRAVLEEATKLRLISDVPLGAFLSGGIDSSITVALMSVLTGRPVRTFSIGFKEKKFNELNYARMIAERYKTEHQEFIVEPKCLEVLDDLVWYYDEPFADSSAIPTYYVSKMTSRFVKVALSGDAGDECFAGYPRYKAVKIAGLFDRLPTFLQHLIANRFWEKLPASVEQKSLRRRLKKLMRELKKPPEERYLRWICIFDDEWKDLLYTDAFAAKVAARKSAHYIEDFYSRYPRRDFLSRTTYVDLMTYLPSDLLVKVDIASMIHSLETRSPFLDHKLVELAGRMPMKYKLRGFHDKYILKRTFQDLLPHEILQRGKMGFGVPIGRWFRTELKDYVTGVLLDRKALGRGYFNEECIRRLTGEHAEGKFDHGYRLWALLILELWHRRFID